VICLGPRGAAESVGPRPLSAVVVRPLNFTVRSPGVTSASRLTPGCVYFTFDFLDEAMRLPAIQSYVYLGAGLLPGSDAGTHVFQTVESFHSDGNWKALDERAREAFDRNCLLTCDAENLELFSDAEELQGHLAKYAKEAR